MSEKKMKFKPQPRISDHPKDRTPIPVIVPVSGGADAGDGGKNFDRAIGRKEKQLQEGTQISGSGQSGELATKLSASSGKQLQKTFRKPDGRIGSISEYPGFAKASKELGND